MVVMPPYAALMRGRARPPASRACVSAFQLRSTRSCESMSYFSEAKFQTKYP